VVSVWCIVEAHKLHLSGVSISSGLLLVPHADAAVLKSIWTRSSNIDPYEAIFPASSTLLMVRRFRLSPCERILLIKRSKLRMTLMT
jgi:hypothetical protein